MCHHLWLGTPLTLSEVRAMLPTGFTADAVERSAAHPIAALADDVRTIVALRRGGCACALYLEPASPGQSTESALRGRYFQMGVPRAAVITALDRHRASAAPTALPPIEARRTLAAFVAEHARNAGPAVYLRTCHPAGEPPVLGTDTPHSRTAALVQSAPCDWLPEDRPILVTR